MKSLLLPFFRLRYVFSTITMACGILFILAVHIHAQTPPKDTAKPSQLPFMIGIAGGYNLNNHQASFMALPGVPHEYYNFGNAVSGTFYLSGLVEFPFTSLLRGAVRLGYTQNNALMSGLETIIIGRSNGMQEDAIVEHQLQSQLASIFLTPMVSVNPFGGLQMFTGIELSLPIQKTFVQDTRILSPNDITFEGLGRLRNDASGTIPSLPAIGLSALVGVGYEVPVKMSASGSKLLVTPEAMMVFGLTPVVSSLVTGYDVKTLQIPVTDGQGNIVKNPDGSPLTVPVEQTDLSKEQTGGFWNLAQIRAGFSLKYKSSDETIRYEDKFQIDTVRVLRPLAFKDDGKVFIGAPSFKRDTTKAGLVTTISEQTRRTDTLIVTKSGVGASVSAVGVTVQGDEVPVVEIKVEEFLGQRYLPLLNYVFFDENESFIPDRYERLGSDETEGFTIEQLANYEPLGAYRHILNIVGRRMKLYPKSKVTLTGCNSNNGVEKGALPLSMRRAEAVREYLQNAWGIEPQRLSVRARNLSERPSMPVAEADKIEENRRVEITSDTPEITEWIVTPDTMRIASPPIARFRLNAKADAGIKRWRLTVEQNNELVRNFSGEGEPPKRIDWEFAREAREQGKNTLRSEQPLVFTPYITDNIDQQFEGEPGMLPMRQITIQKKRRELRRDKEFEQFSLILFDFDRAELNSIQRRTAEFVKSRVKAVSDVDIVGYTDRTGSEDYNRRLAEQRAKQIATMLKMGNVSSRGLGKDQLLYDNTTPEGRYYCRTVMITIETPVMQ